MTESAFNPTQITRAGFEYQDLLGIQFLIEAYQNPDVYEWIALDSDSPVDGQALGGLDDIVALRRGDQTLVLRQVKFTVDPDRPDLELSIDWLLKRRPRGKSNLKRWSERLLEARRMGTPVDAALLTNRRPGEGLSAAIIANRLHPENLSADDWARVVAEIGPEPDARAFFEAFRLEHSQPQMGGLETSLRNSVVPDYTDDDGWRRLREAVRYWSISVNKPRPGGRIHHEDLQRLLSTRRPQPLSQDFRVPDGYVPPDEVFHQDFVGICERPGVVVLTGPPGRGKSTYLSHLVWIMSEASRPVVRHHYFLSLSEGEERSRFVDAAYSLVHQLTRLYPELEVRLEARADKLREWLTEAGRLALASGRTLAIVVDGLDHVWRDTRDDRQINHLFNSLLPVPPGVTLVVGTQPVADGHLPHRLVASVPRGDWRHLPGMTPTAIRQWLERQADGGRLKLPVVWARSNALTEIAEAFSDITAGHPLHLVYSLEALLQGGDAVLPQDVRALPPCPNGDIRLYYAALWAALSMEARELAHLMAIAGFPWPPNGVIECLGGSGFITAWAEIAHLTTTRRSGTLPFHESLVAWVRDLPDHPDAAQRLLPRIVAWLESREVDDGWRWAWLWIMQARTGRPGDLVALPSREWLLDALCRGRPVRAAERILDAAERAAFAGSAYPRVVELRGLRSRLVNGVRFQIQEFAPFLEAALQLSGDRLGKNGLIEDIRATASNELLAAARLFRTQENDVSRLVLDELNARLEHHVKYGDRWDRTGDGLPRLVVATAANVTGVKDAAVVGYVGQYGPDGGPMLEAFTDELTMQGNFGRLAALANLPELTRELRSIVAVAVIRLGITEGIDFRLRPDLSVAFEHPLGTCLTAVTRGVPGRAAPALPSAEPDLTKKYASRSFLPEYLHFRFFEVAALDLVAAGAYSIRPLPVTEDRPWLRDAISWLEGRAITAAGLMRRGKCPGFDWIAKAFRDLPEPAGSGFEERQDEASLRSALGRIGADLELLRRAAGLEEGLSATTLDADARRDVKAAAASEYLGDRGIRLLKPELAALHVARELEGLRRKPTQFDERGNRCLALTRFSLTYGLRKEAAKALRHVANYMLAYGWHKDMTIFDVLYAVEACLDASIPEARAWLAELAPSLMSITEITDGDETNHAQGHFVGILAKHLPEWLPDLIEDAARASDWHDLDEGFTAALTAVSPTSKIGRAVVATLAFGSELQVLKKRAAAGDQGCAQALAEQLVVTGGMPVRSYRRDGPVSDSREPAMVNPDGLWLGEYPPDQLIEFLEELDGYGADFDLRDATLDGWLLHWERMGRGPDAIASLERLTRSGLHYPVERGLDLACEIALRVLGRDAAYALFVHAHVVRSGWSTWWSNRSESRHRLRRVAELFPERWEDFLIQTSGRDDERLHNNWLAVGRDLWVEFFLLVGQRDLATRVARAVLDSYLQELADQPIPPVPWAMVPP
ncbi:NACHT domain-containing protein [Plastoroseomonas hellenica]|uniref:NACHT domain-containing protein n=1 Tax=Plastoroseomonas hellenica TaxID=2687306 RepID=UPI001BA64EB3|nr:NACHT domain-containing protein [Plastoroseomonas hellenica]MBR0641597.1 NACHT domain-containing protein [Plastoroseomonas hellenica]